MTELRRVPLDGIPPVLDTPTGFTAAAQALAAAEGPIAIDTERASAYRYDDRAFLVQIRRAGAGTFLVAPEGQRAAVRDILGPVVSGEDWVLHAAPSDLPSLAGLGLYPGCLFDTELAARLAGFTHPNLGTMVLELLDVELEKGYGDADWSTRPLPKEWLAYAALDVELLLELAEILRDILAEQEKYDWALQEFAHIVDQFADSNGPVQPHWRDVKGIKTLHRADQLALARGLWTARDSYSRRKDQAPGRILPNKVLIDIARKLPRTREQLIEVRGFPRRRKGAADAWMQVITKIWAQPPNSRPRPKRATARVPSKTTWAKDHPDEWQIYQVIRQDIKELEAELGITEDTLIRPAILRAAVWATIGPSDAACAARSSRSVSDPRLTNRFRNRGKRGKVDGLPRTEDGISIAGTVNQVDSLPVFLAGEGARPWQIELITPILAQRLFGDRS